MIDVGFLLGFAFGCISTAAVIWFVTRAKGEWLSVLDYSAPFPPPAGPPPWKPHPLDGRLVTHTIGAAAEHEVADLVVSTGQFVSSVRSLRHQVNQAHASLKGVL